MSKVKRAGFEDMISNYLLNRINLICLFILIDSRHKPQKIDQEFMKWLAEKQIPFTIVFTKSDKLGKTALADNIKKYKATMLQEWEYLPEIFITSAEKKEGLTGILTYIGRLNPQFQKTS